MQTFVKCPFCRLVYDVLETPSMALEVDGVRRTAHLACVMVIAPPGAGSGKPNGTDKDDGQPAAP